MIIYLTDDQVKEIVQEADESVLVETIIEFGIESNELTRYVVENNDIEDILSHFAATEILQDGIDEDVLLDYVIKHIDPNTILQLLPYGEVERYISNIDTGFEWTFNKKYHEMLNDHSEDKFVTLIAKLMPQHLIKDLFYQLIPRLAGDEPHKE